mmetsp:Transcript_34111/g.89996  ORF Transcript_34111/g.89996 Transcript_34111/m.89996 type:complete len:541 (+) Transcript_34111:75-1697(+)
MFGFIAGSAATSGLASVYKYNRDSWMTNVQMAQSRRIQKQNALLSQVSMFREDVRDLVGVFRQKQSSHILVLTIIIGMMGTCYIDALLPDGAFEYVVTLYYMSVGSTLLYLILSLACSIGAGVLAANCQQEMLTTVVRLPIKDIAEELDKTAFEESAEAFEHQHWSQVFRLPASAWLHRSPPRAPPTPRGQPRAGMQTKPNSLLLSGPRRAHSLPDVVPRNQSTHTRTLPSVSEASMHCNSAQALDWVEAVDDWRQVYLQTFREQEQEWEALTRFASIFVAKGVGSLLQAYGYYSVSQYWSSKKSSSWIVGVFVVIVHAILALAFRASRRSKSQTCLAYLEMVTILLPHLTCLASIWADHTRWLVLFCIPVTYLCHFVSSCITWRQLWSSEPEGQGSMSSNETQSQCSSTKNIAQARQLCLAGSAVVVLFWFFCLLWVFVGCSDGDTGYSIASLQNHRGWQLRGADMGGSLPTDDTAAAVGQELAALVTSRGLSGASSIGARDALSRLGVQRPEDLRWIHEEDLLRVGLSLVESRKLLSA